MSGHRRLMTCTECGSSLATLQDRGTCVSVACSFCGRKFGDLNPAGHTVPEYVGTDVVAGWFGVSAPAVCNWVKRELGAPEPAAIIRHNRKRHYVWLPGQEPAFRQWYESRKWRHDGGRTKQIRAKLTDEEFLRNRVREYYSGCFTGSLPEYLGMTAGEHAAWFLDGIIPERAMRVWGRRKQGA